MRLLLCFILIFTTATYAQKLNSLEVLNFESAFNQIKETEDPKVQLDLLNKGINYCHEISYKDGEAHFLLKRAYIYYYQGVMSLAIESFYEATRLYLETNEIDGLMRAYFNMGVIVRNRKIKLTFFEKALTLARQLDAPKVKIPCLMNTGFLLLEHDDSTGLKRVHEAINLAKKLKNPEVKDSYNTNSNLGYCYLNLGDYYRSLGELDLSENNYQLSHSYFATEHNDYGLVGVKLGQALLHVKQGSTIKGIEGLQASLSDAEHFGFIDLQKRINKELSALYTSGTDYENAHLHLKKNELLLDSLDKMRDELNEHILIDRFQKKQEAKVREKNLREAEYQRALISYRNKLSIIFISVFFLTVLLFIILLNKKRVNNIKQRRELLKTRHEQLAIEKKLVDNELHYKKQSVNELTIYMNEKIDFLNGIQKRLKHIRSIENSAQRELSLSELLIHIKCEIQTSGELLDTNQVLSEVTQEFYKNISQHHDDLTPGEQRLLSLILHWTIF